MKIESFWPYVPVENACELLVLFVTNTSTRLIDVDDEVDDDYTEIRMHACMHTHAYREREREIPPFNT